MESDPVFLDAFLKPTPLLDQGKALAPHVSAMMDVSDGLFLDATRMAQASGMTFAIVQDDVPHSDEFRAVAEQGNLLDVMSKGRPMRQSACAWGDDYALLFTASPRAQLPVSCQKIGTVQPASDHFLLIDGKPLEGATLGYEH